VRGGLKRNAGARRQEVLERAGAADRRAALGEQDGAAAAPDASAPGGKLRAGSLPRSPPGAGPRAPRGINSAVAMVRGVFDAGLNRTRTAVDALGPAVAAQLDATRTLLNRTLSGEGVATLLAPARDASRAALHRALNETRARGSADAALAASSARHLAGQLRLAGAAVLWTCAATAGAPARAALRQGGACLPAGCLGGAAVAVRDEPAAAGAELADSLVQLRAAVAGVAAALEGGAVDEGAVPAAAADVYEQIRALEDAGRQLRRQVGAETPAARRVLEAVRAARSSRSVSPPAEDEPGAPSRETSPAVRFASAAALSTRADAARSGSRAQLRVQPESASRGPSQGPSQPRAKSGSRPRHKSASQPRAKSHSRPRHKSTSRGPSQGPSQPRQAGRKKAGGMRRSSSHHDMHTPGESRG
jgi:hypothetical protein